MAKAITVHLSSNEWDRVRRAVERWLELLGREKKKAAVPRLIPERDYACRLSAITPRTRADHDRLVR